MASEAVKKKKDAFGFADPKIEKMMTKHGWNRGVGLGASQAGDAEFSIVVKRKYTKTGLGDDPGKDFKNQWWHKAYDNASKNIGNKCPTEGVTLEKPLQFRAPKLKNGALFVPVQFVKRETLSCDDFVEEMKAKVSEDEEDSPAPTPDNAGNGGIPTFDEMFDACNGLTIHKGARSGITHKGKLQRLQEQEAKMMRALLDEKDAEEDIVADEPIQETEVETVDKKIKKKKKKKEQKTEETSSPVEVSVATSEKKKRKKRKLDEGEEKKEEEETTKQKMKKKSVLVENSEEVESTKPAKKKKKKKVITEAPKEETVVVESTQTEKKKKKKVPEEAQEVQSTKPVKKKKKKVVEEVESVLQQKKKKKVTEKSQKDDVTVKKKKEKKSKKQNS